MSIQHSLLHGRMRSLLRAGGGGGASVDLQSLLWPTGTEAGIYLDPSDAATVYQDSAGTTAGALNQPVGLRLDKRLGATTPAGPGNHVSQVTSTARPTWKLDGSIYSDLFDVVDDGYSTAAFAAGALTANMDCFIAVKRVTGVNTLIFSGGASKFFGVMDATTAISFSGVGFLSSVYVNGVQVGGTNTTTRLQLHNAVPAGEWKILEFRNLDLSTWTILKRDYASFQPNGNDGGAIICPAQSDANRAIVRTELGRKVGLSL